MSEYEIRMKTTYTVVRTHQVDGEVGQDEPLGTFDSVHAAREFRSGLIERDDGFERPFVSVVEAERISRGGKADAPG